ncbi:MAG: hypothetical protein IPK27_16450 [Rhodanobacteraceae bacterium]|nr:hypothetical protein [Rhodanobacteraceae bacterium]
MRRALLAIAFAVVSLPVLAQSQTFSSLEERMTAKDFRDAGLDKLSEVELKALNAWIERNVRLADPAVAAAVAQGQTVPAAAPASESMVGFENARREEFTSSIPGTFKGWSGKTQFTLENGQVWEQIENDQFSANLESPRVTIKPGLFGSWRLRVEGYNRTTLVKRIR